MNLRLIIIAILTAHIFSSTAAAQSSEGRSSDAEEYRRSSLCLILLTHKGKKYAEEMERIFRDFPMPARYNEHNVTDLRVISVYGKQKKSDIEHIILNNNVAQRVVAKWFNRNPQTGAMDMDLIHDRGGYGAFYADYERSQNTVRGTSLLRDEGIELLQSTFVLVCDMDYIDKKKGAAWGSLGLALLSAGMEGMAQANYNEAQKEARKGNYKKAQEKQKAAQNWNAGSALTMAGAAVVGDIGGFRVKMNAYLYRLKWDDKMTNTMYNELWIDQETPAAEAVERKTKFDNKNVAFSLEFVGQYKATSSKTILRSWSNEDEVILDVCQRCVDKGIKDLAKKFSVFKPRTPYYFDGQSMFSHIGTKEEVSYGKKYEIVQRCRDKRGNLYYKSVGMATATSPWNNRDIRFDQYFNPEQKGTMFRVKKSSVDLHKTLGLQLREM